MTEPHDRSTATLLYSFETLEAATRAREAVVRAGVPGDAARVTVREDEAGPVQGNFTVGDGRAEDGRPGQTPDEPPYPESFQPVKNRGVYLLQLRAPGEQCAQLKALLEDMGGSDPTAVADRADVAGHRLR